MRRIYITAVPLDNNFLVQKKPLNPAGFSLNTGRKEICFPIVPVIESTANPGDSIKVLAVQSSTGNNSNLDMLKEELSEMPVRTSGIELITHKEQQSPDVLLDAFEALILRMESSASYYADITFGSKSYPLIVFSALRYAQKILPRTDIKGLYYQEIIRKDGKMQTANLYDITALYSMDSIVDQVSALPAQNKEKMIHMLLHPEE